MPRAAPRRGDVWGGGTNGGRLLGHELDEGADDAVELVMHDAILSDVAGTTATSRVSRAEPSAL